MNFHYTRAEEILASNDRFNSRNTLFICDPNTADLCLPLISSKLKHVVIPAGELNKHWQSVEIIIDAMIAHRLDRQALIVNLGGGIVCDVGGFAASIYQRGIEFINIPTTLMAMCDAGYGGKTGINYRHIKNYIGTFQHPSHVYICTQFLETLPEDELISGYAEIIKHALLSRDNLWKELSKTHPSQLDLQTWGQRIKSSNELKWQLVFHDFRDAGNRKKLNLGHTFGHAFESVLMKNGCTTQHGIAVAAGIICAVHLSRNIFDFPNIVADEVIDYILSVFNPLPLKMEDIPDILNAMQHDKKSNDHKIKLVLLRNIGDCIYDLEIDPAQIEETLGYYIERAKP